MARPKKYDIDTKQVEQLASYGCTNREIASFFGCTESLIKKSYSSFSDKRERWRKNKIKKATMECSRKRIYSNAYLVR